MGRTMTWEEIKKTYPDELVAVANFTMNEYGDVDGEVVIHSPDKEKFYQEVGGVLGRCGEVSIQYTGEWIKNTEVPLLWQISHS